MAKVVLFFLDIPYGSFPPCNNQDISTNFVSTYLTLKRYVLGKLSFMFTMSSPNSILDKLFCTMLIFLSKTMISNSNFWNKISD